MIKAIVTRPLRSLGVEGDVHVEIRQESEGDEQDDLHDEPRDGVDHARRHGRRRCHAEALEEADVDGDTGRRAGDGEVDVADGELQRRQRTEGQLPVDRAQRADGGGYARDLGEDERRSEPPPVGVLERLDEGLEVQAADQADQGVCRDEQQGEIEDRALGDPAQPDQVLVAGVQRRAHALAHVVELDAGGLEGILQARRHGGLLQERKHGHEALVAELSTRRRDDRLLGVEEQGEADQLCSVLVLGDGLGGDGGGGEVAEAE